MKQARSLATRLVLCCTAAAGITVIGAAATAPRAGGAPTPLTLTETWNPTNAMPGTILDDAPCGLAQSSPALFNDGGIPSVAVGDRQGFLYGLALANGAPAPGWGNGTGASIGPVQGCVTSPSGSGTPAVGVIGVGVAGRPPVDSTASVGLSGDLYFGAGNAASPVDGGYYAYAPNGTQVWNQVVTNPPSDSAPDGGVQASLTQGDGGQLVEAGSLGQETYALSAQSGAPAPSWPQFTADSVFSTAAAGDLYGTGSDDFVSGGASSSGFAYGKHYTNGGHLRITNDRGGLICSANTTEEIDSSPAVGPVLDGSYGIATGTGSFFGGSDQNTVKMFGAKCNQVWSDRLNGTTGGSPALANITGTGALSVIEGTVTSQTSGSVYALDGATGATIWRTDLPGAVFGSVTTANFGTGYQDVIVPTTQGLFILDGQTGIQVAHVDDGSGLGGIPAGEVFGFQNAALVTADGNGTIGITVAGYFAVSGTSGVVQGIVQHFEVTGSSGALANQAGGWPQFHHDAGLTGFVGGGATLGQCDRPAAGQNGYLTVASDGGIFAFGQDFCGSTGSLTLNKPVVGMAAVPGQGGYWLVASDGGIFSDGDAGFFGSTGSLQLTAPVVAMAPTPDGKGYWLVASDGGIFSYGDAGFYGSAASVPGQDIVGMAATPDGLGYWEVSTTGRVFTYGDAQFAGDTSALHLNAIIVGITPDPVTGGYWLIGSDGGVFSFDAPFYGSTGGLHLNQPVVAMQSTLDGGGYWFVASDGGIFSYGDATFRGSMGGQHLNRPMVGMDGF
ncbi:MAG TPA: PQQ-binding-like beta-propeller repeat protein [Acidimicrobiales bacterium]|nr:PQQ-binding-like beta-propeller repeat protein [Acidimicrobiales bacterium]